MKLNTVIVDDEPLARDCLVDYVGKTDFLSLSGTAGHPIELKKLIDNNKVDLVFLDIQMPVMNGIDYLRRAQTVKTKPMVILTTAFQQYAIEGYHLDVLDYLLKPITYHRFLKGATKAREFHELQLKAFEGNFIETANDHFFIKCNASFEKIYYHEIIFIEAMQNYILLHTDRGKFMTLMTMQSVTQKLDPVKFVRIHKSYIVSIARINAIDSNDIQLSNTSLPLSRNFRDDVLSKVVSTQLWKK